VDYSTIITGKLLKTNDLPIRPIILAVQDFRELLDKEDVDAVNISNPDHWHTPMTVIELPKLGHLPC
jgi:predicted dehydrogenase